MTQARKDIEHLVENLGMDRWEDGILQRASEFGGYGFTYPPSIHKRLYKMELLVHKLMEHLNIEYVECDPVDAMREIKPEDPSTGLKPEKS